MDFRVRPCVYGPCKVMHRRRTNVAQRSYMLLTLGLLLTVLKMKSLLKVHYSLSRLELGFGRGLFDAIEENYFS
mgnify:CR=1 FL=1